MNRPARVFFNMDPGDPDVTLPVLTLDHEFSPLGKWAVVLGDLVCLVEVWVEVVLS